MKHIWVEFTKDRQRAYAISLNVLAQLTAILSGVLTPSQAGSILVWSFCVPFNVLLVYYLKTGNLQRYTIWGGVSGLIFLMAIAWAEGGIRSSTVSWFVMAPLALHYLVNEKMGLYGLAVSLLMLIALTAIDQMGWVLDPQIHILDAPVLVLSLIHI